MKTYILNGWIREVSGMITAFLMVWMGQSVCAANITSTWTGTDDGSAIWNSDANWDHAWPRNFGGDNYFGVIGDSSGDRIITVPAVTLNGFSITQTSLTGSTTLKFTGNLNIGGDVGFVSGAGVTNTTGDLSRVKFDLNGQTINLIQFGGLDEFGKGGYTVGSSNAAGTGIWVLRKWRDDLGSGINVEDNVTIRLFTGEQSVIGSDSSISKTSTIQTVYTAASAVNLVVQDETPIGNLVIGLATNTAATKTVSASAGGGGPLRVLGDVTIHSFVGATNGAASEFSISTNASHRKLYVAGNFTDAGSDSFTYGNANVRIYFNGGDSVEKTLSTGRSVQNAFQVGEDVSLPGNLALGQNLTTTGNFTVLENSRLNVQGFTLSSGSFLGEDDARFAFTFGGNNGVIETGDLTLGEFDLQLVYDNGGWHNGDNFVLFHYTGAFTGTPNLGQVLLPENWTYDALIHDDTQKTIYLSNLTVIPEPSSLLLLLAGASLLCMGVRARQS